MIVNNFSILRKDIFKSMGYRVVKRIFDIVASSVSIVALSWLFLILAIIVKASSDGPVFFCDERIGKNGNPFKLLKFRTMVNDAEENIESFLTEEQYQEWLRERKINEDPRITEIGYSLRRLSLDELPQLFNVFTGSMSVIGPRPISSFELETNYTVEEQELLLSVKPGLSGNWAANGRNNICYRTGERQSLELEYIEKKNFLMDMKLIGRTLKSLYYELVVKERLQVEKHL